jgi:hypothetical protein
MIVGRHWFSIIMALVTLGGCGPGKIVTDLGISALPGSAEARLSRGRDGEVLLSYLEPTSHGSALRFHMFENNQWSPQYTVATGTDWLVNWADFPSVVPIAKDLWAAHWLVMQTGGGFAYDTVIAVSNDRGATWSIPVSPHTDGSRAEHGFVSLFGSGDAVGAIWLDGRAHSDPEASNVGMQLRSAVINDDGTLSSQVVIDELVCDCCQTDLAVATSGPIAVYRNRSDAEIRDIFVSRRIGGAWRPGKLVAHDGWEISGCPVNGPAVDAEGDAVAVAWYTTAPDKRIQVAFSHDSGASFDGAINLATQQPVGRVDISLVDSDRAIVSWLQGGSGQLASKMIHRDGTLSSVIAVAPMEVHRNAGFPQMTKQGDTLIFAWTDTSGELSQVRSARVDLSSFK